jgi:threonine/homoserine/homoserine lactone efflux protein
MIPAHFALILGAAFVAVASPGPAVLAIANISMRQGRRMGLAFASGVSTGSVTWSVAAAFGLGALMLANAWLAGVLRYAGAAYLLFLACKAAQQAMSRGEAVPEPSVTATSSVKAYFRGLALHLTNPKAIFFFGSLYTIGVSPHTPVSGLLTIIVAVGIQSVLVLHGYALLFSSPAIVRGYFRIRRGLQGAFALAFGAAGVELLIART